ncbi:MAG TPA: hypothetical protein VIN61_04715 [Gammaproteobacteria bacterium]
MTRVIRSGVACALMAVLVAGTALAQGGSETPADEKQRMTQLGLEHATARDLYEYFKRQANGGKALTWREIPDWTGIWTREASPFFWDPDQTSTETLPPSVKLTPAYEQELRERVDKFNQGIDYDPLSMCNPAGMPRWLVEPFLREFIVTPHQVWLVNEMMNEIRRVYTDGRDHPSEEDAYPLWEGDSIGFWDGDRLVIHTAQMREGMLQRIQPRVSDQVEVVEIWQKTADDTMVAHVWLYDPQAFREPWYTKQVYKKLSNDDKSLRIRYWHCGENPNNVVIETEEGASDFADFTFTDKDDE